VRSSPLGHLAFEAADYEDDPHQHGSMCVGRLRLLSAIVAVGGGLSGMNYTTKPS
jgi:hypothetical protein